MGKSAVLRTDMETIRVRFVLPLSLAAKMLLTIPLLAQGSAGGTIMLQQQVPEPKSSNRIPPDLPDDPSSLRSYPVAQVIREDTGTPVSIESDSQTYAANIYTADGHVVIHYTDYVASADHVVFNRDTREVIANGNLHLDGGPDDVHITADHGTMNLDAHTGHFFNVNGTLRARGHREKAVQATTQNLFVFEGREVFQDGPQKYRILDGWVTSCQLPNPDWMWSARRFTLDEETAHGANEVFRLFNVPLLYLPYVAVPVRSETRQSGFLIPWVWTSSTKGLTITEGYYWAINRSADLTVLLDYFSMRGWQEKATFRYKGFGDDFATASFSGLQDRGYVSDGVYVNQGGQDAVFSGRHDLSTQTRVAANIDYLSSFPYQEAFSENFSQAASTDILSYAYVSHEAQGYLAAIYAGRYQGLKRAASTASDGDAIPEEEVKILHVPSLIFDTTDHALGTTGIQWSFESSASGLKRSEPGFTSSGVTERIDLHPKLSYPVTVAGWHLRSSLGLRDTIYSHNWRVPLIYGVSPTENVGPLNRTDVEMGVELRTPLIERTFDSGFLARLFGGEVKHTIEPELTYRYVGGIGNTFLNVPRFDDTDVASNTNELEYGVTQRLFLRPARTKTCATKTPDASPRTDIGKQIVVPCGNREWISWRLTQKRFFDPTFGGAVVDGRRNIFDTTLNLTGIAFLTQPRDISPLVSRMRVRMSDRADFEWNLDLDTGAKKVTSNNVLANVHEGNWLAGLSYTRLNAPGRAYSDGIPTSVSNSRQLRILAGYGSPDKPGFGVAASTNLDLNLKTIQYEALQSSYNWNCCGLSVEYGRYDLGSVRDESFWRYSFTLKNIATVGNLKHAASLF